MIFKQYFLGCLAHASYLVADEQTRIAAVVDPQRDIEEYIKDANAEGLQIRYVILTHFHADFVSGHLELRDQVGAEICLGARAEAEYRFRPLREGDVIEFGRVRLKVLETPGHTPEGISILVYDLEASATQPHAVLTGDTLFIGDVGRPDLMASAGMAASDLAGMLYDSLHQKLLPLPDDTLVYPAHGAGSMCGKNLGTETVSTIGAQRQENYALQPMKREDFIAALTADQPDAPRYFGYDAMLNRQERATLDRVLERELKPLSVDDVARMTDNEAQVLDVRSPADFAEGHMRGSLNIGLGGQFATWVGTMLDSSRPLVIVADPPREREAATRLGRIGFDQVAGYVQGGGQAIADRPDLVRRTERITATRLAEILKSVDPPCLLDVRTESERREGLILGSLHIPLNRLQERMAEVPRDRVVVVHCASGYRSAIAASLLQANGYADIKDLIGGYTAWEKAGSGSQAAA